MQKSKENFYNREAGKMNMSVSELKALIKRLKLKVVPCHCGGAYVNCTGYELTKLENDTRPRTT